MLKFTCKTLLRHITLHMLLQWQTNFGDRCTRGIFMLWCVQRSHGEVKGHFRSNIEVNLQDSLMTDNFATVTHFSINLGCRWIGGPACNAAIRGNIGVRDHFHLGAQHFLPEFLIFARKVEYVWAMHFCLTRWGGGGGEQLFWSDWVWDTTEGEGVGGEGVSPSHDGIFFFWNLGTKNQVLVCVIILN